MQHLMPLKLQLLQCSYSRYAPTAACKPLSTPSFSAPPPTLLPSQDAARGQDIGVLPAIT